MMRTTYDKEADVLGIVLDDAEVEETRTIAPGVEVDYGSDGRVLAIEFLNAGKKYDLRDVEMDPPPQYHSLAQASQLVGLSPTTLRHQIARGVLRGKKFGRNWMVRISDLEEYAREHSRRFRALTKSDSTRSGSVR